MAKSQPNDVVVTGLGPVTSIGVGNEALWSSLSAGRSNVQTRALPVDLAQVTEFPVAAMPPAAEVPDLSSHMAFLARQECASYRDLGYALLAIELALADAGVTYDRDANQIGVIQAFEAPGSERTVTQLFGLFTHPMPPDKPPQVYELLAPCFYHSQPFLYVHLVGKALGLHGFSSSVHNGCASGAFAIELAAQRIREGLADVMVVAGGEAFDTGVRLEWFRRLGLYACDGEMRPFDAESSGFYVGEGAGAIVLESASHAARRGAQAYATYLGGAFAQQSWKQTIPDVRAGRLRDTIQQAMSQAAVQAEALDLIVPHGAATGLSDGYEAACLDQTIGPKAKQAVATVFKPYVGHMLAGCAIIETICTLLAMKHQCVPKSAHRRADHTRLRVPLATSSVERAVKTVLKLSTGFTGHDAALVFAQSR